MLTRLRTHYGSKNKYYGAPSPFPRQITQEITSAHVITLNKSYLQPFRRELLLFVIRDLYFRPNHLTCTANEPGVQ